MLATCLNDLLGVHVSRSLSGDLLVRGTTGGSLDVTPQMAAAVSQLGEENVSRWRRLRDASPFIASLAERVSDPYLNHGLRVAEAQGAPGIATFRARAQAEGGPTAFVRARIGSLPQEFAAELDRAILLYGYFESWPSGFRPDGPPDPVRVATDDTTGCAVGIGMAVLGGAIMGATVAAEVLSAGLATPVAFAAMGAGATMAGSGAATAAHEC
jgi:hypothetical protein